jgi:hypothetical protein
MGLPAGKELLREALRLPTFYLVIGSFDSHSILYGGRIAGHEEPENVVYENKELIGFDMVR